MEFLARFQAVERAKIEEEGKIKAARENEDVNTRLMQAEQAEKRLQMLAAIQVEVHGNV